MNTHDYSIWENPDKKEVNVISHDRLSEPHWIIPESIHYIIDWEKWAWESVPRSENTHVVAVLPVTPDGKIILIEERRIPFMTDGKDGRVIGIPAGLVDAWEDTSTAALREMQEEIWHSSDTIDFLTRVTSSEWLTNEEVTIFVAQLCEKTTHILDGYEEVWGLFLRHEPRELIDRIYAVPHWEIDSFLESCHKQGMKRWSKIDAALRAYEKKILHV